MPDISMCVNGMCPSKDYCHRYTATPSEFRQSYGGFGPEDGEDKCDMFWPNSKDSTRCKLGGVKRDGEMCNLDYCTYPKCVQDSYCPKCHKVDGVHKMSCETRKVTVLISEKKNSPLMEIDRFPVSGDPGIAVPIKDENGSIVDWKLFDSDDEVKAYYEQMDKEVHQNRSNLNE
jgi:hypothetical protein